VTVEKRRGGPLATDRLNVAVTAKLQHPQGTSPGQYLHHGALHVIAIPYRVVARSGRARWLLVYRCTCAGGRHVAQARDLVDVLTRTSPCGQPLAIHVAAAERAA
jgi:hypothetical protein